MSGVRPLLMTAVVSLAVLLVGSACAGEQTAEETSERETTAGRAAVVSAVPEEATTETVALQSESEALRDTVAERAAEERARGGSGRER